MTKTSGSWVVYEKRAVEYVHASKPFQDETGGGEGTRTAATGVEIQAEGAWCRFRPVMTGIAVVK
jgi:hypothetical protein